MACQCMQMYSSSNQAYVTNGVSFYRVPRRLPPAHKLRGATSSSGESSEISRTGDFDSVMIQFLRLPCVVGNLSFWNAF